VVEIDFEPDPLHFDTDSKQLKVCFLRFFLNGTEAEFSPRVDEFEYLIGESLYIAIEDNIMLYYSVMVAKVEDDATGTIVTVSISSIMNKTTPLQLNSPSAVAAYVSSLITHDTKNFALHDFAIKSIYILESGSGDTIIVTAQGSEDQLSGGALSGIVIIGMIATLMAITVVLMVVYIRYATVRRAQNQERRPLIPDNDTNRRYQQINLTHKEV
jgi:hypothetical protein